MAGIAFPLGQDMRGHEVATLQRALQLLLDKDSLLKDDLFTEGYLSDAFARERGEETYGPATRSLVTAFQREQSLDQTGEVDEATAHAIDGAIVASTKSRARPRVEPAAPVERPDADSRAERLPPAPPLEPPLTPGSAGPDVALVHDILGGLGYPIHRQELRDRRFGPSTVAAVREWQTSAHAKPTGTLDPAALARLWAIARELPRTVRGVVKTDDGTPVPGLDVTAFDQDFRNPQDLGSATTDRFGRYRIEYSASQFARAEKASADLGIRVRPVEGETPLFETSTTGLLMNAPRDAVIDVVVTLPVGMLPTEYDRIAAELRPLVGEVGFAEIASKDDGDEGLFLARETGTDIARIGHFVAAHRLADISGVRAEYFYALLREDGLFGITPDRPRVVQTPVGFGSDTEAVLYEAVLLGPERARSVVKRAVRNRVVPPSVEGEAGRIAEALRQYKDRATQYAREEVPRRILSLIETLIEADKAPELLAFLGSFDPTDLTKLYERLDGRNVFVEAGKEEAAHRLHLAELLGFNMGLVQEASSALKKKSRKEVHELARLRPSEWTNLVRGAARLSVGGQPLDPALARRQASILAGRFEAAYPTVAFVSQMARRKPRAIPDHDRLAQFLESHPGFEFRRHRLTPFLLGAGVDPKRLDPRVIQGVERLQRVFQLTGTYRKSEGLLKAGYGAAADVVAAGRSRFVADARRYAAMSATEADTVFRRAADTNLAAVMVATSLRTLSMPETLEGDAAMVLSASIAKVVAEQPDLKSLFGSTDACECTECRSIYSPAAYFADVMRYLRNRLVVDTTVPGSPSTRTAKEVLFARRQDLGEIDLNCDNAKIPIPHVDMVAELLEEAVSPDQGFNFHGAVAAGRASAPLLAAVRAAGFEITDTAMVYGPYATDRFILRDRTIVVAIDGPGPNWHLRRLRQTHGTPEERAASPEYVNAAAYVALAGGVAAFGLPFDLFHAETLAFLQTAGIRRADLMEALVVTGAPSADAIAAETLGLSDGERALIVTTSPLTQPQIWSVAGPAASATLQRLDVLMQRTELDYREVEALIAGIYVRGASNLFIHRQDTGCDLATMTINALDDAALDRIHRVLRLARKTGLAVRDVDRLATAPKLGNGNLGAQALRSLADLVRVSETLKIELGRMINWLDVIPTDGERSAHATLFENVAATGRLSRDLMAAAVRANEAAETAVPGSGNRLAAYAADLATAFGVRPADIALLVTRLEDPALFGLAPPLTFATIAALNGRIELARALALPITALLALERLTGIDPLSRSDALRDFVGVAGTVTDIGVPIAELEYRLARRAPDLAVLDLGDDAIGRTLQEIRADLVKAEATTRTAYDVGLTALEQIVALETMLQRQPGMDGESVAHLLDLIRLERPTAADAAAAKAVIDGPLANRLDAVAVKAAIDLLMVALAIALPAAAERKEVLRLIMAGLAETAQRAAAVDAAVSRMTVMLGTPREMTETILRGARLRIGAARTPLIELLTTGAIASQLVAITPAGTPDLYRALRLAHAVVGLTTPFKPPAETVAFMLANATTLGWLELDGTPFEAGVAVVPLARWLQVADVFALVDEFPAVRRPGQPDQLISVPGIFLLATGAATPKATLLDDLAVLTGWPRAQVDEADVRLAFAVATYGAPATWRSIRRVVDLLRTLGVPMGEALAFSAAALGDADRVNARRMLRARYSDADWLGALKGIMDPVRERKRDALVAYLLAVNPALTTKADLYDHFLTDTEWSAKMPSSRLVHAHGTLQLFIQRCIAGLEPRATADLEGDLDWSWWDGMKKYRVWEVERKVFTEAQYYLRPEWRDDKTEAFKELEETVLQKEINDENVNEALEGFLDRVDQLAFLDVLATCYDFDRDELHVFAATKGGDPRVYFHRTLQRERVWTAWTKIDLDIAGDHLVAFFRDKRLYLGWTTFAEKGDDQQQSEYPEPGGGTQDLPPTQRRTEIKLAVSEYSGRRWRPRRVSQDALVTSWSTASLDHDRVFVTVSPDPARFTVDVHLESDGVLRRVGYFLLTGCKGYPEAVQLSSGYLRWLPEFKDTRVRGQRLVEQDRDKDDELAITSAVSGSAFQTLFGRTPGIFRVSYPFQASDLDRLLTALINGGFASHSRDIPISVFGTLMPLFFEDNQRGYVLIPGFFGPFDARTGARKTTKTFSNIYRLFRDMVLLVAKYLTRLAAAVTVPEKEAVIAELAADPEYTRILAELDVYRGTTLGMVVRNFYHPLACFLRQRFFEGGPKALLARATQLHVGPFRFEDPTTGHAPAPLIVPPYPREEMEFTRESAYADINWELGLHIPHLVSSQLMATDRFDEAETWLRYIFDPLGSSNDPAPQRYWNTKPFYQRSAAQYGEQLISSIMNRISKDPSGATETELADAILDWRRNPFKPYLVARSRTVAFQQAIVHQMARVYMGRGDRSFRADQLEDLVQASLDYSRVERLLGPRPQLVPPAVEVPPETYNQLEASLDLFGNALRKIENLLPDISGLPQGGAELPPLPITLESLYFCIPPSEKLYDLWNQLEERQFNLRNSRTIDGVERSLSLFAPPLSVEALLQAAASGMSISAILASLSAPRPPYRFRVMLRHAIECTEAATSLAKSLEQALTSRDGEGLSRLKAQHEIRYLKEQTASLTQEIAHAGKSVESVRQTRSISLETQHYFEGRPYMNAWEIAATAAYGVSLALQAVTAIGYIASGGLALVPSFMIGAAGFGGSPTVNAQTGGKDYSSSARDFVVGAIGALAGVADKTAGMLEHQGNYKVRSDDWGHQAATAKGEVAKADIEIAMARIKEAIAKEQLRLHGVKSSQAAAESAYLSTKFTNQELFEWLAQEVRGLTRQMFNVAFEAAMATQNCFNFELGVAETFVRSGQWNDARRGLMASENLLVDLRRMESAYFKRNVREREITKQLSLARLDPIALLELRTTGRCMIQIPEAVFDLEHPGQYFRRIKTLAVSVPCVAGPFSSVPLKLTQTSNRVRVATTRKTGAVTDADAYAEDPGADTRFRYNVGAVQSISTSRGDEDGGVFALELTDERYTPFEGSGLVGTLFAELPQTLRPFEYGTISDLVLHVRYTARDGGGGFRTMVENGLRERLNVMALKAGRAGLFQAFDLRRDRPDIWHQLVTTGTTKLKITKDDLPYYTSSRAIAINATRVVARVNGAPVNYAVGFDGAAVLLTVPAEPDLKGLLSSATANLPLDTPKTITAPLPNLLEEMTVIVNYSMT